MTIRLFSVFNLVMAAVFTLWAVYQYNDPDPLFWMLIYGLSALACVLHHLKRLPPAAAAGFGVLVLGYGLFLAYRVINQGHFFSTFLADEGEESREMMGSILVFLWMSVLYWRGKRKDHT